MCESLGLVSILTIDRVDMKESASNCNPLNCPLHYHVHDPIFVREEPSQEAQVLLEEQKTVTSEADTSNTQNTRTEKEPERVIGNKNDSKEHSFQRIIRNFTPS